MNMSLVSMLEANQPYPQPVSTESVHCRSKAAMRQWLDGFSVLQVGETAKKVHYMLRELWGLDCEERYRLELMEMLQPKLVQMQLSLARHYHDQHVVLDHRAMRIAELSHQLRILAIMTYRRIALGLLSDGVTDRRWGVKRRASMHEMVALALYRALHGLSELFVDLWTLYLPVYRGGWLRLHELYQIAREQRLTACQFEADHVGSDADNERPALSIHQLYLKTIFLSGCQTNSLRPANIQRLAAISETWSHLFVFSVNPCLATWMTIDPKLDQAPTPYPLAANQGGPRYYLDIEPLRVYLAQQHGVGDVNMDAEAKASELLQYHLLRVLRPPMTRRFERMPGSGEVDVALGIIGTHFQAAGQSPFEEVIQAQYLVNEVASFAPSVSTTNQDYFDIPQGRDCCAEAVRTHHCRLINTSQLGYGLYWDSEAPLALRCGELISVFDGTYAIWRIGLIRWLRQQLGQGVEFGVEILQVQCAACGVRNLHQREFAGHYMRGLLLASDDDATPQRLLVPCGALKPGHKVALRQQQEETIVQLRAVVLSTPSFSIFEYERYPAAVSVPPAVKNTQSSLPFVDHATIPADLSMMSTGHMAAGDPWRDVWDEL